jgi:Amt family ammonium transporter
LNRWNLALILPLLLAALTCGPVAADDVPSTPVKTAIPEAEPPKPKLDNGDTAWMLGSTGLVLLMVPGLALFYGGMVRRKNILGTMMHSMVALSLIGIQWVLFGYSLAFGITQSGWFGWSGDYLGLHGVNPSDVYPGTSIPVLVHCMYQGMFAIITPALISGAVAERIRFGPYCLFIFLWAVLVYDPLAHWVWAVSADGKPAGWLGKMGALDFAGGTVVHISAGFSALAAILVLRKRLGYPEHAIHPSSMVLTLLGAGLLWFGWFGFNGGSALNAGPQAGSALAASQVAAAAAALSWVIVEWLHKGKPTALGLASGLVAGLVAVTPASGFVTPLGALVIGLLAGAICYGAVCMKPFCKYDDSLDAFGVHGIGGFLGAVLTGVFAAYAFTNNAMGNVEASKMVDIGKLTADAGRATQIVVQLQAALVSAIYAFGVSLCLVLIIDKVWGFTLEAKAENEGLDRSEHGEVGFDLGPALEMVPEAPMHEPRAATVPPNGRRHFTVIVEGANPKDLIQSWSRMCGATGVTPSAEFRAVYPNVTTVQGNRFRFRDGDPSKMRDTLQRLFANTLEGSPIQAHVEN